MLTADGDLRHKEIVDVPDAVLGTSTEFPNLDGSATVKMPPATQPGSALCLRAK